MHCGIRTRSYRTKEDACEAWNTWAGGRQDVPREDFLALHESLPRDYPIQDGKLLMPDGEHAFGDLVIAEVGGYESPWPRIYFSDYPRSEAGEYGPDDMFLVYKLRARWRRVNRNHQALRRQLVELLERNDRHNILLNRQLADWNETLAASGFPRFEKNDLRGVDLSGLHIVAREKSPLFLRHADLRYAELLFLELPCANLYGARLSGTKAVSAKFEGANLGHCDIRAADLMKASFAGADLGFADFTGAFCALARFDGANCYAADFSGTSLRRCSFKDLVQPSGCVLHADLSDVRWNRETQWDEVATEDLLREQNRALGKLLDARRDGITPGKEALAAVKAEPGIFGFSVDLRRVGAAIRSWFSSHG